MRSRKLKQGKYYYDLGGNFYGVSEDLMFILERDFKQISKDDILRGADANKYYYIVPFFSDDFINNLPKFSSNEAREFFWHCDSNGSISNYRDIYKEHKNLMGDIFYDNLFGEGWKKIYKGPKELNFQDECYEKTFTFGPGQITKFNAPNVSGCSIDFEIIKPYVVPEIGNLNISNRLNINNKGAEIDGNDLLERFHKLNYLFIGRMRAKNKTLTDVRNLHLRKSVLDNLNCKGETFTLENCNISNCTFEATDSLEVKEGKIDNSSFISIEKGLVIYISNKKTVGFDRLTSPKNIDINVDYPQNFAIKTVTTKMLRIKYKYGRYYSQTIETKIYINKFIIPKGSKNLFISGSHAVPNIIINTLEKEDPNEKIKLRVNNAKVSINGEMIPDNEVKIV